MSLAGSPYVLAYLDDQLPVFGQVLDFDPMEALTVCNLFPLNATREVQTSVHRVRLEPLKRESPLVGAGLRYWAAQQRLELAVRQSNQGRTHGFSEADVAGLEQYERECRFEYNRENGELRNAIVAHVSAGAPALSSEPVLVHAGQGQRARFAWVVSRFPATGLCRVLMINGLSVEGAVCMQEQLEALAPDDPLVDLAKACMAAHERASAVDTEKRWAASNSLLDATSALSAAMTPIPKDS